MSKSFRGSTNGIFGLMGFLSWPSTILFRGFSFGGLVAIIFAISPFVNGNGAVGPLITGGGGGGGGGGGMLHGGEIGLGGVGSGVGGGGGRSWGAGSVSSVPNWPAWFGGVGVERWLGRGLSDRLPVLFSKCGGMEPEILTTMRVQ